LKKDLRESNAHEKQKRIRNETAAIRRKLLPVLKRHDIARAALFGSYARGEGTRRSDLDILVEFKGDKSLLDLVELKYALEKKTDRKVDVLTYRGLHPAIRERILDEQVPLL
jgi:predicted nucleotidyltransferase